MPGVTSIVPYPLGATMDVSVSDVWITDCTIISSRSDRSPYMLFSHTSICSLSVCASDSSVATSSRYMSPMVAGGISEVAGGSTSSTASNSEVQSVDFK
ncbi:hypothetical protein H5410_030392 [Solanum commersonii]|uniref:Uncharacterized protein n=1 Tax=Solanum commersonii TaxID=4109 RepID=A0A9J5YJ77_SOLCO|nr:hypothetical protein H5410_030392 [Solanum commersonii]